MIPSQYITLILVWIFFGLLHSVLASGRVKRAAMKMMGHGYKYYRAIYSLITTFTLIVLLHYHFSCVDTILWRPALIEKIIATLCVLSGFVVMIICIWKKFVLQFFTQRRIRSKDAKLLLAPYFFLCGFA